MAATVLMIFVKIIPTREITTKIEKTFLFLVRGRGPNVAAPIAPTLIRHWLTAEIERRVLSDTRRQSTAK